MNASYHKEIERLYNIRDIATTKYGVEHPSWSSKLKWKTFVSELGINTAATIATAKSPKNLVNPKRSIVLKPERGAANRGVFLLQYFGEEDRYYSRFDDSFFVWDEIVDRAEKTSNVRGLWIIEEYLGVEGESLDNWEFYCFAGEVGLIRQRRQKSGSGFSGRTHKHYSFDWTPLSEIQPGLVYDQKLPGPLHPEELLDVASRISVDLPFVFSRIDLYDTRDGVFYGEVTMHPGVHKRFLGDIDVRLGQSWLDAEARRSL